MSALEEIKTLQGAGFTDEEVAGWTMQTRKTLSDGGFGQGEIDTYFGQPPFDPKPVVLHISDTLEKASQPTTEGGQPKPVTDFTDALKAGFGESVTGLLAQGKPAITVSPDAPMSSRIAGQVGSLAGDVPAMVGGYLLGGRSPIMGMAGAFALPAGIRKILMDKYDNGEAQSWGDFWERFSGAFIDTAKGWITGAATGAVGKAIGLAPIVSPTMKSAATVTGEIATMVTVGKALEGQMPEPQDFVDTAITLGFVKGSAKVAGKLRNIYAETGVKPDDVAADVMRDPTLLHDLMSMNVEIPKAYHGTPTQFETFDVAKAGDGLYGKGLYFTSDKNTASLFGNVREAGLALGTPLQSDRILTSEVRQKFSDALEARFVQMESEQAVELRQRLRAAKNEGDALLVVNDTVGSKDTAGILKQVGFDSLILPRLGADRTDYVVFDNKQIKAVQGVIQREIGAVPTVENIHALADSKAIQWDSSPAFMDFTEQLTGKRHLDDLTPEQRTEVANALEEWAPTQAMGGGAPNKSVGEAQQAVLDRLVLKDPETQRMTLSDMYTSVVDNLNPIKQALKADDKVDLPTAVNPYSLERLTRGIAGKASEFLNAGAFDFETYKTKTKGYFKILEPVKNDLDGFRAYMVAKRTVEKAGQGIETGVPMEHAKTVVREGRRQYEDIHQERLKYRDALLDTLQQSGILSAKAVEAMKEANKDYVPFYRFFEDEQGRLTTSKQVKNPVKKMMGSERQILDPIMSDIKDTFLFVGLAEKNAARQAFVELGQEFATKQAQPLHVTHLSEPEIKKLFDEFVTTTKQTKRTQTEQTKTTQTGGVEGQEPPGRALQLVTERVKEALKVRGFSTGETDQMLTRIAAGGKGADHTTVETVIREIERTVYMPELDIRLPNEVATIFRAMQAPAKADEIAVFTNGHRDLYKLDPKVAEAFNGLDAGPTSLLAKIAYAPASLLRAGVTITPDFAARNIIRDAVSAFIYAGSNPIKTALGLKSIVTQDTAFHNWMKGGGANATMVAIDRDYLSQHLGQLNAETGLMRRAWNVAKTPLDILRATSELVENSTRIGAVRSELLRATTKAQIQALSLIAREATVDFARHGKDTQGYARSTAFFNPAIQGIDRFAREARNNPLGMTAKAMASVTLPSMLLWYANRDDKEIQDTARWQKRLFWLARIPLPDGQSFILRIPKPQEFGILFGTLPEELLDEFVAHKPDALRDIEKTILEAFTPSLIPTAAVPIIAQFANMDMFRGRPLIPAGLENLLPEYQYMPYTTELAKAMGQLIGAFPGMEHAAVRSDEPFIGGVARALTTPILIENYVRDWTGGMGMYLFQLADKALREAGVLPDPVKAASTLSESPFFRAFTVRYPSATAQSIQDFYSDYDVSKKYYDTILHLAKDGDVRAVDLLNAHSEDLAQLSGIRETLTQQGQIIRMIEKNPQITAEEKRQLEDTLIWRMIELSQAGNASLRQLKEQVRTP